MRTRIGRAARRPLAEASALAAAGELVPPGGTVGLILLIAHLRLNKPERVTIAYLTALISELNPMPWPGSLPNQSLAHLHPRA